MISWLTKTFFTSMLVMSCVLGLSVNSPLMLWAVMEINMLLFIPILGMTTGLSTPDMMSFKYFFTQSLASIILFLSLLLLSLSSGGFFDISLALTMSLAWKMGTPPFHMWLFNLLMDMDWALFFIISSWQKILPFYMMSQIMLEGADILILLSLLVAVMMALYQSGLKKLLIISSIFTSGWVMGSMIFMKMWWLVFFMFYCLMLFFCCLLFYMTEGSATEDDSLMALTMQEKVMIFFLLMSMGGLPPLLGFYMKFMVLAAFLANMKFFLLLSMIMSSVLMIYLYLSFILSVLTLAPLTSVHSEPPKLPQYPMYMMLIFICSPMIIMNL